MYTYIYINIYISSWVLPSLGAARASPMKVESEAVKVPEAGDVSTTLITSAPSDAAEDVTVTCLERRVQGAGFRVQGAWFRVQGSGFRV